MSRPWACRPYLWSACSIPLRPSIAREPLFLWSNRTHSWLSQLQTGDTYCALDEWYCKGLQRIFWTVTRYDASIWVAGSFESCVTHLPEIWRILPFHVGATARHIALSDALVRFSHTPTIWWHETNEPTLLLGAGQSANDFNRDACVAQKIRLVRRHSGGTAVYAGPGVLGLDVMLPAA